MNINRQAIFDLDDSTFESFSLALFQEQAINCLTYKSYLEYLQINPEKVKQVQDIPCLPISAFKHHEVKNGSWKEELFFSSSGTTGDNTSKHAVKSLDWYKQSFERAFKQFYGEISDYCVLALLPAYLERSGSSLVYMVEELIQQSKHRQSSFYLYDFKALHQALVQAKATKQKTLLIGVSFALLDFVESFQLADFPELVVMETGGMKGRHKEITRAELHDNLSSGFGLKNIHSEYGMTELFSQAYSKAEGLFECPGWMKVFVRQQDDPFQLAKTGETGGINIIDLANIDSCAFIQTDDLGRMNKQGQFEVLGRFDRADVRGCNLLI